MKHYEMKAADLEHEIEMLLNKVKELESEIGFQNDLINESMAVILEMDKYLTTTGKSKPRNWIEFIRVNNVL